jgi:peroxiredoxin
MLLLSLCYMSDISAAIVELNGKITMLDGGLPATVILKYTGDEGYTGTANIVKDGSFSFSVDVPVAGLYTMRFLRSSYDVMLSAAEKVTTVYIKLDKEQLKDIGVEKSPENDAYKAFRVAVNIYDAKLRSNFVYCEKEDSCEKELHTILSDFAEELTSIQKNFKGTYTATVLCKMRMPAIARSIKNTSAEFRKGFFENVPFGDTTIFNTPVYKEMIGEYADFLTEPSLSKENQFVKYFTDKIRANDMVLHKSAGQLFEELLKNRKEKMLGMFIAWYNTGDNKTAVNNPVLDIRLNNISKVMPGRPYVDVKGPDAEGMTRTLKEVVDKSRCTLLLFWSSDCPHCRDEMPFIKEYYEKYHAKGFNIYAISLENNVEKWKKFVSDKGLVWTNVISGQMVDPNPAMQYVATTTPTMVLIDNKGIILHRFIPNNKLEKHIEEALQ